MMKFYESVVAVVTNDGNVLGSSLLIALLMLQ